MSSNFEVILPLPPASRQDYVSFSICTHFLPLSGICITRLVGEAPETAPVFATEWIQVVLCQ